jgi:glycosyltransferase involved in cell wall biosynthesis
MNDKALPLISVIIAAYNAADYIAESVYSVLRQSHTGLEIIVIDDGSKDATADIMRTLARQDERVVLLTGHTNEGVSAARNRGLAHARGDWVAILDADDLFHEKRLELLLAFATTHGLDVAADNLEMRDFATGAPRGRAFPDAWMAPAADITIVDFLERDLPGMFARELGFIKPIMRTEFLRMHGIGYNPSIWAGEDFLLYLDCLKAGAQFRLLPDALYIYHLREGSASSGRNANLELQRGNTLLLERLAPSDSNIRDLLLLRQMLIRYELFNWRLKSRDMVQAMAAAAQLPVGFLCSKLFTALLRRLGLAAGNPSLRKLQRLRQRRVGSTMNVPT